MTTLKNLVDETTVIKNELKTCHINLKNNLVAKGVEVLPSDKMLILIDKVNNVSSFLPSNKQISLEILNLGTMPNDIKWVALADDKLVLFNSSNNPYKNILDLETGETQEKIKQGSISAIYNYPPIFGNHTLDAVYCRYIGTSSAAPYKLDLNTLTLSGIGTQTGFLNYFSKTYIIGDKIYCFATDVNNKTFVRVYDTITKTNILLNEVQCTQAQSVAVGGIAYDGGDCLYSFGRYASSTGNNFNLWKYTISTNRIEHLKQWSTGVPSQQSYSLNDLGKVVGNNLYVMPSSTNNVTAQIFSIDLDTYEIKENLFGIRHTYPIFYSCNNNHVTVTEQGNGDYPVSYIHFRNK